VEHGININKENLWGETTIFIACRKGYINVVKYLVEHGVDLNKEGNSQWIILLLYACQKDHKDIVKYLMDKDKEKIESLYRKNKKQHIIKDITDEMFNKNKSKYEHIKNYY